MNSRLDHQRHLARRCRAEPGLTLRELLRRQYEGFSRFDVERARRQLEQIQTGHEDVPAESAAAEARIASALEAMAALPERTPAWERCNLELRLALGKLKELKMLPMRIGKARAAVAREEAKAAAIRVTDADLDRVLYDVLKFGYDPETWAGLEDRLPDGAVPA